MGSLNNGQPINKDYNRTSLKHQGKLLRSVNSLTDTETTVQNSGVASTGNYEMMGVVWAPAGTVKNQGLSLAEREADNTVNRELFTNDATVTGFLEHTVTRSIGGKHASVSERHAKDALEAMRTVTERKVFSPDDWTIYNANGVAVGATLGTTDTDITPSGVGTN